jgi:hypothetical protein
MPEWQLHEKWGLALGIPTPVVNYVNQLIDGSGPSTSLPKPLDYLDFLRKEEILWRRRYKGPRKSVVTTSLIEVMQNLMLVGV